MTGRATRKWLEALSVCLSLLGVVACGAEAPSNAGNQAAGNVNSPAVGGGGGDGAAAGQPSGSSGTSPRAGAPSSGGSPAQNSGGNSGATSSAGAPSAAGSGGEAGRADGGAGGSGGSDSHGGGGTGTGSGGSPFPVSEGKPTVYLAADSTVQTYSASQAPQQGWGQRIQEFFTSDVSFVNKAIGGRSSKSFIDEGRLDEISKVLKKGDYLFCQWGINDRYKSDPDRYTDPATTFRDYLKQYIAAAKSKNAIAVLVTPTPRLDYVNGMFMNDFQGYCDAIKAVGTETQTPVIDLQTKALAYYTSVGYDFVEQQISLDVLHFKEKGAQEMARLVAEGTKELGLPISGFVK
ncbi:MAG TPA: SGNH/GDSL hydrolase family protein [Polyangiaceae bacterium]|nr:SGNH/GDSL hydrolase family protein [Polyangiaceae bacterium]